MEEIRNKVAESGIITIDLNELRPPGSRLSLDIAAQLWEGIALREKDFRAWIRDTDWNQYADKHVAVYCSVDAVIPSWAFMLIAAELESSAQTIFFGNLQGLEELLFHEAIKAMDVSAYADKRIMLKGCGDAVPMGSYLYLTERLRPVVKSLMFGEPCSAVPVFKAKKA